MKIRKGNNRKQVAGYGVRITKSFCLKANLETMFQALREATLREGSDDSDGPLGLTDLAAGTHIQTICIIVEMSK